MIKNTLHTLFSTAIIFVSGLILYTGELLGIAGIVAGVAVGLAGYGGVKFAYVSYGLIALGGGFILLQSLPNPSFLSVSVGLLVVFLSGSECYRHRNEDHSFLQESRR